MPEGHAVSHAEQNEQGTRWFFGKPYHWQRPAGTLVLFRGTCPSEEPPRTKAIAAPTAGDGVTATVIKAGAPA